MLPNVLPPGATDHLPVLADEVRRLLAVSPGETVVDCTFGAGGHASLLAADLQGQGRLIAIDRDPNVDPYFEAFRRRTGVQARLLHGDFATVLEQLAANGREADAIPARPRRLQHADRPPRARLLVRDRCAARHADGPWSQTLSARELVNEESERELATIFKRYGEERYARQIARAIVRRRRDEPFERTGELVDTIKSAIPAPARFGEGHPAKRVFQALRIAVNDELGLLERALPPALQMLRPGGRLAVISFHSLEDRIVKRFLRDEERGCTCPPDFPICVCGRGSRRCAARSGARRCAPVRGARRESALGIGAPPCGREGLGPERWPPAAKRSVRRSRPGPRRGARARCPAHRAQSRRGVAGGVLTIAVIAVLLAGVVALNVAVLRLNVGLDRLGDQRSKLRAENAQLASQVSAAASSPRIQQLARSRYGLVPADPALTTYIDLSHESEGCCRTGGCACSC